MSKKMQTIKNNMIYVVLLIVTFLTTFCMLITFDYWDLDSMTAWSLNVWDLLFQGRLGEFYQYAELNLRGAFHENCAGNYLWLLPWCIWNFPLWIVHTVTGVMDVTDFWSLCWSKLYLVNLSVATAWMCAKITRLFTEEPERIFSVYILILAAPELLMSTCYAGQDEILYVFCFVTALYFYLKGEKKYFYFWSLCAISFCTIMIVPFLLLLLLKEKRIIRLGILTAGTLIPTVLFDFLYRNDKIYLSVKTDFTDMILEMFGVASINTVLGPVSILGGLLVILYFYCYGLKVDHSKTSQKKVIYVLAVVFILMGLFMGNNFYRLFLYVPFLVLLLITSEKNLQMNLFLLLVSTFGRSLLACAVNNSQNMNTAFIMKSSWISNLSAAVNGNQGIKDLGLYDKLMLRFPFFPGIVMVVTVCAVAAMALLVIINYPKYKIEHEFPINEKISLAGYVLCMPFILVLWFITLLH